MTLTAEQNTGRLVGMNQIRYLDGLNDIDSWAVDVVVREGARMNLRFGEKIAAAHRLRSMGLDNGSIAERMRTNKRQVERYLSRPAPDGT